MSEETSHRATVSETGYAVSSQYAETKRKKRESTMDSLPGKLVIFLISISVFVVIWQVLASVLNDSVILAPPLAVLQSLGSLLAGNVPVGATGIGNLYSQIGTTIELIAVGYLISLVGIPIGIVMGRWKSAESIIDPWINALWAIPMVALTPLIYPLTGGTFSAAILVVVLISIFTIIVNTYSGVKYTSNSLAEVGKTFNASEFQFMTKIVLPASLPEIVAGMRLGLGRAVLGAVVAEILVTFSSLGQAMLAFQNLINTPAMMSIVFIVAIIGIVALQTPKLIEHYAFKWKETERMQRGFSR